ncbi:hypothetical protein P1X15_04115 [Runella sp. MFBS21]|uniref:hypothetical protein n=1 Tax=Runella sp. MFBS21 TaxID=3034018 RepID=UPI0023F98FC6|nr:hypothetical protein [Runella sp. MFBS21]MDF7816763.1 hypothetical protein [Runella sp. MFBS21]
MNPNFKLRFDQMKESNPAENSNEKQMLAPTNEYSLARPLNLCLRWPEGKCFFLNYAYLVAGEFTTGGEQNEITLYFSDYTVRLKGYELEPMFLGLLDHLLSQVELTEARYLTTQNQDTGVPIVTEIEVEVVEKS